MLVTVIWKFNVLKSSWSHMTTLSAQIMTITLSCVPLSCFFMWLWWRICLNTILNCEQSLFNVLSLQQNTPLLDKRRERRYSGMSYLYFSQFLYNQMLLVFLEMVYFPQQNVTVSQICLFYLTLIYSIKLKKLPLYSDNDNTFFFACFC